MNRNRQEICVQAPCRAPHAPTQSPCLSIHTKGIKSCACSANSTSRSLTSTSLICKHQQNPQPQPRLHLRPSILQTGNPLPIKNIRNNTLLLHPPLHMPRQLLLIDISYETNLLARSPHLLAGPAAVDERALSPSVTLQMRISVREDELSAPQRGRGCRERGLQLGVG